MTKMSIDQILATVAEHQAHSGPVSGWFVGVRFKSRLHPWDEQELPFPTRAWINLRADTGDEAQRAVERLLAIGYAKSSLHTDSPSARCVFAYHANKETPN
jgi:hypothetical protein